ncbi:MAG: transketolase family protein [Magnetovibrio sp.]|nr:transketolase family protein [Magnetovibrio sp.]
MISLREAFGNSLVELAKTRDDFVVLDADVAGGTGVNIFRDAYPDRFIQCAIAEQNMVSMAAGLASTGVIPIVTCYAVFASMRAIEQARNGVGYPNFNVKIAASHIGMDVGPDGASHQCVEDVAIYRAIPNYSVVSPADPTELKRSLSAILDHQGPVYFRTGRSPVPEIEGNNPSAPFLLGKGQLVREGTDLTIIAVGIMVHRAVLAAELLATQGVSCRVVNMASLKPIDRDLVIKCAAETGAIVTAEDHNVMGGLGSAVAEVVVSASPCPMDFVGIQDTFGESGEPDDLAAKYGLTEKDMVEAAERVLARKVGQ